VRTAHTLPPVSTRKVGWCALPPSIVATDVCTAKAFRCEAAYASITRRTATGYPSGGLQNTDVMAREQRNMHIRIDGDVSLDASVESSYEFSIGHS